MTVCLKVLVSCLFLKNLQVSFPNSAHARAEYRKGLPRWKGEQEICFWNFLTFIEFQVKFAWDSRSCYLNVAFFQWCVFKSSKHIKYWPKYQSYPESILLLQKIFLTFSFLNSQHAKKWKKCLNLVRSSKKRSKFSFACYLWMFHK